MPSDTRDVQILPLGTEPAPADFVLPAAAEIIPKAIQATFDGSGTAVPWKPAIQIISDSGHSGALIPTEETVAAGGSATVSWFPKWKRVTSGGGCPLFPGATLCGAPPLRPIGFASGSGPTLDITLLHAVPCAAQIVVACVTYCNASDFANIALGATDNRGTLYEGGKSSITAASGPSPSDAIELSFCIGATQPGTLHAGDTITVTFDNAQPTLASIAMVVAVTNVGLAFNDSANGITFPGTTGTSDTEILWRLCPGIGEPFANFNGFVGGELCAIATFNTGNTALFDQATLIEWDGAGALDLTVGIIPSLSEGQPFEPGGTTDISEITVANYIEFVGSSG